MAWVVLFLWEYDIQKHFSYFYSVFCKLNRTDRLNRKIGKSVNCPVRVSPENWRAIKFEQNWTNRYRTDKTGENQPVHRFHQLGKKKEDTCDRRWQWRRRTEDDDITQWKSWRRWQRRCCLPEMATMKKLLSLLHRSCRAPRLPQPSSRLRYFGWSSDS